MCLIVFAWKLLPDCPLLLAANRDEFFARPAEAAQWWQDQPHIYAGRDLQGGGTWLGMDKQGRFAALTNIRNGADKRPNAPSRGALVANYLRGQQDALTYLKQLAENADQYQGFNLIVGDAEQLFCFSNADEGGIQQLAPGIYGLSNGALNTPWPKVDATALVQDEIELMLQVNGKLRGAIVVPAGASKVEIELAAIESEVFKKISEGAAPKKVIVVPGCLVNLVI